MSVGVIKDEWTTLIVYKWLLKKNNHHLQTKTKEFTRLTYTGLVVELEHLKIETRLIDEKFANARVT